MSPKQIIVGIATAGLLSSSDGMGAVGPHAENSGFPPLNCSGVIDEDNTARCYFANDRVLEDTWEALDINILRSGRLSLVSAICPKDGNQAAFTNSFAMSSDGRNRLRDHDIEKPREITWRFRIHFENAGLDPLQSITLDHPAIGQQYERVMSDSITRELCSLAMEAMRLKYRSYSHLCDAQRSIARAAVQAAENGGSKYSKMIIYDYT